MTAETLLSRLEKVRQRGTDQWSARCPAHDDKGPSLSVKELSDGRVLLRCFAGCEASAVVEAVGLELADLFPPRTDGGASSLRRTRLLPAGQALELLADEALLVAVAASNLCHGIELSEQDRARLVQAAARIAYLRDEVCA
ncbi:MAG TPA: DNA primase [Ideonella sp.]|uniref:DNA primase n=1 Tax=Ideonella sp. TaxID=1929293 RepID=UPI002E31631A|nr:DNA primase [Ideonella sp.]HEX5687372.1 DNA primase [Ideonella sp.]